MRSLRIPALVIPALAASLTLLPATPSAAGAGDVVVGGMLVLRMRVEAGGLSAAERAVIVEQRITEALSRAARSPEGRMRVEAVTLRQVGAHPVIFAGEVMIVTVDANHARINGTTPEALARLWLRNLQEALPRATPLPLPGAVRPFPAPAPS